MEVLRPVCVFLNLDQVAYYVLSQHLVDQKSLPQKTSPLLPPLLLHVHLVDMANYSRYSSKMDVDMISDSSRKLYPLAENCMQCET